MHIRRPRGIGQRMSAAACLGTAVTISALALSGCGHARASGPRVAKQCGASHTAANVPVTVQVNNNQMSCSAVLTIEKDYASAIEHGKAPGNGGGGPVSIDGWTCQGFPTPVVLKTGNASKCVKGSVEILATLSTPA